MRIFHPYLVATFWLAWCGAGIAGVPSSAATLLQPYVEKHELAGEVVLVADKDKVLAVETAGFADIANRRKMKENSLFWIASQTKPMTATAVMMMMMLVDEGKIALDDPVEKYLPEFRDQKVAAERRQNEMGLRKPAHPITIREVLSHMSGVRFDMIVLA